VKAEVSHLAHAVPLAVNVFHEALQSAALPGAINIRPAFVPLGQSSPVVQVPDGSAIPAFRGAHAVRDALAAGSAWFGASVHRVIAQSDRGPILTRRPVYVPGAKSEDEVMERRPGSRLALLRKKTR